MIENTEKKTSGVKQRSKILRNAKLALENGSITNYTETSYWEEVKKVSQNINDIYIIIFQRKEWKDSSRYGVALSETGILPEAYGHAVEIISTPVL